MKYFLIVISCAVILSGCSQETSCPEIVTIETPYGVLQVVNDGGDDFPKAIEKMMEAEKALDRKPVKTPGERF